MLRQDWPESRQLRSLDLVKLRAAIATGDVAGFLAAVDGVDLDDALHQVAAGIPMLLEHRDDRAETFTVSVINRLTRRDWDGDDVLAQDLIALLRHGALAGRAVPVDLEILCAELEGDTELSTGGYLDLQTGEVINDVLTDPAMVGDDAAIDIDEEPDRWLRIEPAGSRDGWHDMAAFVARLPDTSLAAQLQHAIEGKGAFRRFRDLIDAEGLTTAWRTFSTDRQLARARAWLAAHDVRVTTHHQDPDGPGAT